MHPSNAFSLHDNNSSSPPPTQDSPLSRHKTSSSARSPRPSSNPKVALTSDVLRGGAMDASGNGTNMPSSPTNSKPKPTKRRKATPTTANIDNVEVEVLISPALQSQNQNQNGHHANGPMPTRSRHKKSKRSKDLAVDITAANTHSNARSIANGNGNKSVNGSAVGTVKGLVVDWEIPRKVLHSSIGFLTVTLYLSQRSPKPVIKILSSALLFIVPCDYLRLRWPGPGSRFARLYERCVGFLMRESEKRKTNGVIWYILGVNFALLVYPLDIAIVAILILSWADTAASTVGRLYGPSTPPLPPQTPLLRLPLAPRKSSAGFIAATITGALITTIFYKYIGPFRPQDLSWTFEDGVRMTPVTTGAAFIHDAVRSVMRSWGWDGIKTGGWVGLSVLSVVAGFVAGIAEALDLGSLDDNLTLPIISGGCIWGFFKLLSLFSS